MALPASAPITEPIGELIRDEEIVERVVTGDVALFEILIRRHNQRIYRAVRAVLGTDDEVEDVMQQAYLNAYQHLPQFAGNARFSTWLTRIAVNEALGRRRKRDRSVHGAVGNGDDEVIMNLVESTPDPEQQATASELRQVLEREIAALSDSFRLVLVMRDVEGLSTAETAACLDVSEDLVKTRLHRGRTLLRDNLYRRAGVSLESVFTFGNARCDRVVGFVMNAIQTP
jgi:RNA polymerase sigma-70 factor (ECF subfamily)